MRLIAVEKIEEAIAEMDRMAATCHRAALDNPVVAACYTGQAMAAEQAALYLRKIVKDATMTAAE